MNYEITSRDSQIVLNLSGIWKKTIPATLSFHKFDPALGDCEFLMGGELEKNGE